MEVPVVIKDESLALIDDELAELEEQLQKIYAQAAREVQERARKHLEKFRRRDAIKAKQVESGKLDKAAYIAWRRMEMLVSADYQELVAALAEDMLHANEIAASIINGFTPAAYAAGRNFAAYELEKGVSAFTSFTLYDRRTVEKLIKSNPDLIPIVASIDVPKDLRWNKQKINNSITQSILQGESIPHAASRLQKVAAMNNVQATRTARTAMTAAQNAGRIDGYEYAKGLGLEVNKQWLATMDGRVRDSHAWLDGTSIPTNEVFPNGCDYPGDPGGEPAEIYNCRCTLVADIKHFKIDVTDKNLRPSEMLNNMSYDEWKQTHKKPEWMEGD